MREIKFRAWHKESKKMLDVYGLEWSVDSIVFREKRKALLGEDQPYRWHMMHLIGKDGVTEIARGHEMIASEYEIMQFTGLLDKDGKEIYEGDIVDDPQSAKEEYRGVITFGKVNLGCNGSEYDYVVNGFYAQTPSDEERECTTNELNRGQLVVIGNIYENPELVEGGEA